MEKLGFSVGFVYVLTNKSMPGLVKIGMTRWLPEDRAKVLFSTGLPTPFNVEFRLISSCPEIVERKVHELLADYRVNKKREFFELSVKNAIDAVCAVSVETGRISEWESSAPHKLQAGDRLVLTLEQGQIFGLISYAHFYSKNATIQDLWQVHSNGDLLEVYVTDSATHVAGMSDSDVEKFEDTVPFLDREKTVPNGIPNGYERLLPGDRLLWVSSPHSLSSQNYVIFEAAGYVQIISRTWSLKSHNGFPLMLNDFMYNEVWEEARKVFEMALGLSMPRCWAPRTNRGPEWEEIGTCSQPPEYWLSQLKRR